jgi:hypothetical protein
LLWEPMVFRTNRTNEWGVYPILGKGMSHFVRNQTSPRAGTPYPALNAADRGRPRYRSPHANPRRTSPSQIGSRKTGCS